MRNYCKQRTYVQNERPKTIRVTTDSFRYKEGQEDIIHQYIHVLTSSTNMFCVDYRSLIPYNRYDNA